MRCFRTALVRRFGSPSTRPGPWPSLPASGTRWTAVRKVKEGETTNDIFAFLTTEPNKEVGAIHPKAMPVVLTAREEIDVWMNAPAEEALASNSSLLFISASSPSRHHWSFGAFSMDATGRFRTPVPRRSSIDGFSQQNKALSH
jgi:hypothetical protein